MATKVKYRKMLYCPKCFSRKHIYETNFIYTTEINKNKESKSMELIFFCSYCKKDFKLKMEGVINK